MTFDFFGVFFVIIFGDFYFFKKVLQNKLHNYMEMKTTYAFPGSKIAFFVDFPNYMQTTCKLHEKGINTIFKVFYWR